MFYRRKILLAILQLFGGKCKSIDFQKYLFLFNNLSHIKYYHFIPYKYGCFSFQSYADKRTLTKYTILENTDGWIKNDNEDYISQLSVDDKKTLFELKRKFGEINGSKLIEYIYKNFPYYAMNSEIIDNVLDSNEREKIIKCKNRDESINLFTIGYEGRSIDEYLNLLIKNNVKILCDVRKNAKSMKYGFSKKQLKESIEKIGIEYCHLPELGIESDKRKPVNGYIDYKLLFREYREDIINNRESKLNNINKIFHLKKRMALTCFEADVFKCHRYILAKELLQMNENKYQLLNI